MASIIPNIIRRHIATAVFQSSAAGPSATAGHGAGSGTWKKLSFFVAIPAVLICALNTYLKVKEHPHERAPFVKYDYLRKRDKRFPWGEGQKSLFHNPHFNALPDGYEN